MSQCVPTADGYDYAVGSYQANLSGPLELAQLALQIPGALGQQQPPQGQYQEPGGDPWYVSAAKSVWGWVGGGGPSASEIDARMQQHLGGEGAGPCPDPDFSPAEFQAAMANAPDSAMATLFNYYRNSQGTWFDRLYRSPADLRRGPRQALRNLALGGADCHSGTSAGRKLRSQVTAWVKQYSGARPPIPVDVGGGSGGGYPTDWQGTTPIDEGSWWDDTLDWGKDLVSEAARRKAEEELYRRLQLERTLGQDVNRAGIGFPGGATGLVLTGLAALMLLRR